MRFAFTILGALIIVLTVMTTAHALNSLKPFTTDGCSVVADGNLIDPTKWRKCCVIHDLAYWQGGTSLERARADLRLSQCIGKSGEYLVALFYYVGVRLGGEPYSPASWNWGYGWSINRGYAPLSLEEKKQVEAELAKVKDIFALEIQPTKGFDNEILFSGDHCYDRSLQQLNKMYPDGYKVLKWSSVNYSTPEGYGKVINIKTDRCDEEISFKFLLLKQNACTVSLIELLSRLRIRLLEKNVPSSCQL